MKNKTFTCSEEDIQKFRRLDHFLEESMPEMNRTQIKKLHELGCFSNKDSTPISLSKKPSMGLTIYFTPPNEDIFRKEELIAKAANIPLDILFEDEYLAIINKQVGLVTHPAPGHPDNTLVNAILFHFGLINTKIGNYRPGIVHRLDKGTSGIMVVAKNEMAQEKLIDIFSRHDIVRKYQSLSFGIPKNNSGIIESTIGRHPVHRQKMKANTINGKPAITHYKLLKYFKGFSHFELTLETGRTHQIRVHLAQIIGNPILMDSVYSTPSQHLKYMPEKAKILLKDYDYPLLHACHLSFEHPITKNRISYSINPPELYQNVQAALEL